MTERIKDSLNPVFIKGLEMDFHFEAFQRLKFVVYDIDYKNSTDLSEQDYLGEATTDLGSIIGTPGGQVVLNLTHPKPGRFSGKTMGQIVIHAEELATSRNTLNFKIRGLDLTKKGLFKSRPTAFFVIQRANENGTFSAVYRSHMIESEDDPEWKAFSIRESAICNGDRNRRLKIDVMNHKSLGVDTLIGSTAEFTVDELSRYKFPRSIPIPPMTGTTSLIIQSFSITDEPTFLDFIAGGGEINLGVAIDFTASNGDPRKPTSLHFRNPTGENEYTRAIRSVGDILQCYDTDKKFPVYGFGGHVNGGTHHAFPLNGNPNSPEVHAVEGILESYWHAHSFVALSGPTNFSPVITEATRLAKGRGAGSYMILLILTDGMITDLDATLRAINEASNAPLSIIIVGVGSANFQLMSLLDGDDEKYSTKKGSKKRRRDIVQFVAAHDFRPDQPHLLAAALLAEVPTQFMEYMKSMDIKPKPKVRIDPSNFTIIVGPDHLPPGGVILPSVTVATGTSFPVPASTAHPPPVTMPAASSHPVTMTQQVYSAPAGQPYNPTAQVPGYAYGAPSQQHYYPPQGAPGYPPQGAPAYPPPHGAPAYPPQGAPAYPPYGAPAYPPQGAPAYPPPGAYPPHGAPGYPPYGAPAYPPQGAPAYPPQGVPSYPPQEAPGHPPQGPPANPAQAAPAYPLQKALTDPSQGVPVDPSPAAPADPSQAVSADPMQGAPAGPPKAPASPQQLHSTLESPANSQQGAPTNPPRAPASPQQLHPTQ
ncbi:hypothetical protein BGZ99_008314 [Dissophora globulifera]|uniref:Uncharacterized protein n=1 Tax=Dissophora globulifera TaxID=979702 RepID=A0A9P6UZ22_9FUNG|nr:hypothetical protein BGZ99_008314 [Dissophora globulifera]